MEIDKLVISQSSLRRTVPLCFMVSFVQSGGYWTKESLERHAIELGIKPCPLIAISRFPDGILMVHDGHHRVVSTFLGKRDVLREDEFTVVDWTYEDYLGINLEKKWVTPFDPRTEVRLADFADFKRRALTAVDPETYIRSHKSSYACSRKIWKVRELALHG